VTHLPFEVPPKEPRDETVTVYTTVSIASTLRKMAEDTGRSVAEIGHLIFERALETPNETPRRRATDVTDAA